MAADLVAAWDINVTVRRRDGLGAGRVYQATVHSSCALLALTKMVGRITELEEDRLSVMQTDSRSGRSKQRVDFCTDGRPEASAYGEPKTTSRGLGRGDGTGGATVVPAGGFIRHLPDDVPAVPGDGSGGSGQAGGQLGEHYSVRAGGRGQRVDAGAAGDDLGEEPRRRQDDPED